MAGPAALLVGIVGQGPYPRLLVAIVVIHTIALAYAGLRLGPWEAFATSLATALPVAAWIWVNHSQGPLWAMVFGTAFLLLWQGACRSSPAFLYLATVVGVVAVLEARALRAQPAPGAVGSGTAMWVHPGPVGTEPVAGYWPAFARAAVRVDNKNAWTWSTDRFGLRASGASERVLPSCAPVFGDSFAWGAGVSDHETLSARIQERLAGVAGINFGYPGAGPHLALDLLQREVERTAMAGCTPLLGVFYAGYDPFRPVGAIHWQANAEPRYELRANTLVRAGDLRESPRARLYKAAMQSLTLRALLYAAGPSAHQQDLYVALLREIETTWVERYRVPMVIVVFSPPRRPAFQSFVELARAAGVTLVEPVDVVPDFEARFADYVVDPVRDGHASARFNVALTTALVERVRPRLP